MIGPNATLLAVSLNGPHIFISRVAFSSIAGTSLLSMMACFGAPFLEDPMPNSWRFSKFVSEVDA
jgi:hypothetical protein